MEIVVLPMTLKESADAVGGFIHDAEPDILVTGPVQYDSRLMEPGGLFAAFQGQSVDGHDFASRAVAGGASASTSAALRTAVTLAQGRRLVAVLGHMGEIGPDSPQHHTRLRAAAADAGVRYLIGVGNADVGRIVSTAVARGVEAEHVPDAPAALNLVRRRWAAGDVVLVKGAHALGLQSLAQQLEADGATQDHANAERNGK